MDIDKQMCGLTQKEFNQLLQIVCEQIDFQFTLGPIELIYAGQTILTLGKALKKTWMLLNENHAQHIMGVFSVLFKRYEDQVKTRKRNELIWNDIETVYLKIRIVFNDLAEIDLFF